LSPARPAGRRLPPAGSASRRRTVRATSFLPAGLQGSLRFRPRGGQSRAPAPDDPDLDTLVTAASAPGRAELELKALLDAAVDAVIVIDHRGCIDTFNRSA
ncbi:MAG: hypothetical protein ACK52I_22700, partial [Pseudomonadota bacterium]